MDNLDDFLHNVGVIAEVGLYVFRTVKKAGGTNEEAYFVCKAHMEALMDSMDEDDEESEDR